MSTSPAVSASASGLLFGKGRIFGPRSTCTASASSAGAGGSTALSSMRKRSGSVTSGMGPSVRGSVIAPVSAAATAVSGDTRYTCASFVPLRPRKLRLNVRRLTPPELGEKPMPMHGPHAHSSRRAPLESMSVSAPQSASMVSTCFDPGETDRLTPGATVLPLSRAATFSISSSDEFVQEPMQT